jgi:hypothetical protein
VRMSAFTPLSVAERTCRFYEYTAQVARWSDIDCTFNVLSDDSLIAHHHWHRCKERARCSAPDPYCTKGQLLSAVGFRIARE